MVFCYKVRALFCFQAFAKFDSRKQLKMPTMKNIVLISVLLSFFIQPIMAQDADVEKYLRRREGIKYPNVLKINTLALPFNNISMSYERGVVPRFSIIIAAGYKYSGALPDLFDNNSETIDLELEPIVGYSFSPELRYYLKSCDNRILDGFYAGLYFRHTHYNTSAKFDYFPEGNPTEFYDSDIAINEFGVGISIGYQLMLWERLSIDFMLFGPRYSNYHLGYEFDREVSQEFLDDLNSYINEVIDRFGIDYTVDIKQDGESRASTSFSFANARIGISFGFAF